MKIGLLDLDTSHPSNWVPIIRELGHEVVCVHDQGEIHPPEYANRFAKEHGIPTVCSTPDEMIEQVDCAFIHSCNWDRHIALARPFVEAGRAVYIDKPLAGCDQDINQLVAWSEEGARIFGGSALRFCAEAKQWLAQPIQERGEIDTVICGCGVDGFNYGIHAYALLAALMGDDAISVRHLSQGGQCRIEVVYPEGRCGLLVVGPSTQWLPFHCTIVTNRGVTHLKVDANRLYHSLLESVLPYLSGQMQHPPIPIDQLAQPERWALAAKKSLIENGQPILLDGSSDNMTAYDGDAFSETYRCLCYPTSQ